MDKEKVFPLKTWSMNEFGMLEMKYKGYLLFMRIDPTGLQGPSNDSPEQVLKWAEIAYKVMKGTHKGRYV